ncbi:hypothetical protein KSP35_23185 [Aquihabitans sp. G128]|uniref:hypothetical protein n=1 Tax=Aquihabitans sp. G128 TaxID=2849779 RepID=UPI001C243E1C|nr:hypothetical protein [Aquihabitans sp. G128]QXC61178.1 hypothetical protein KSP35_23185 [Aquihabitans sp. G128]
MRSPRRSWSLLACGLFALAAVGCGVGSEGGQPPGLAKSSTTEPTEPPSGGGRTGVASLPSKGELPVPIEGGPAATVRTCEVDPADPGRAHVEAVVANTTDGVRLLQGVPLVVRDDDGHVVSADQEDLWSSIRIGPARRALLREDVDLQGTAREVTCELGRPDLRVDELPGGDDVAADDLALTSCSPMVGATVRNRSDDPAAVAVVVEAFDADGYSAGTFELGQRPTTYTDGRTPGPDEVALPGHRTGRYRLDPTERIEQYGTPLDGPIAACQVLRATIAANPTPTQVIVD